MYELRQIKRLLILRIFSWQLPPFSLIVLSIRVNKQGVYALFVHKIHENEVKIMKSKELSNYLERLRAARNISQESFTNGITSLRQYRRYLSGESDIPFQILELETARIEESKEVDRFYNFVVYNNRDEIEQIREKYSGKEFLDYENKMVYEHSVILFDFMNQKINAEVATQQTKDLINFSKFSKQSIFTLTEMFILTSLLDLDPKSTDKQLISSRLKSVLTDSSIVLGSSVNFAYQLVLFRLAKYAGINKDYNDVISYCKLALSHAVNNKNYYLLEYFYYYSSLAYFRLGDLENYQYHLMKCFVALHLDGNDKKIEKFTSMINRDFNISFADFVIEHYRQKQPK